MLLKVHCTCKENKRSRLRRQIAVTFQKHGKASPLLEKLCLSYSQSCPIHRNLWKKCCSTLQTWHLVLKVLEVQDRYIYIYTLNADVLIHWTVFIIPSI